MNGMVVHPAVEESSGALVPVSEAIAVEIVGGLVDVGGIRKRR